MYSKITWLEPRVSKDRYSGKVTDCLELGEYQYIVTDISILLDFVTYLSTSISSSALGS